MKVKYLIVFFVIGLFASCDESESRRVGTEVIDIPIQENGSFDEDEIPVMTFTEKTIEAGKITQGEVITHSFEFTNTGKAPLLIANVDGSCGCTIPRSYPKGKVMPGESGKIEVEFNSDGKAGIQNVSESSPKT